MGAPANEDLKKQKPPSSRTFAERRSTSRLLKAERPKRGSSESRFTSASSVYNLAGLRRRGKSDRLFPGAAQDNEPMEMEDVWSEEVSERRGLGLAAKFTIPVCVLLAVVLGGWGFFMGRDQQKKRLDDAKSHGVTWLNPFQFVGKQILLARARHKGAWPIVAGIQSRAGLVRWVGLDLEKKILGLGYKGPSDARAELLAFHPEHPANKQAGIQGAQDLAGRLEYPSVPKAVEAIDRLNQRYREEFRFALPTPAAPEATPWIGLSEAPLAILDSPEIADRIDRVMGTEGSLRDFFLIPPRVSSEEPTIENELIDAYLVDTQNTVIASLWPRSAEEGPSPPVWLPSAENTEEAGEEPDLLVQGVEIASGQARGMPCLHLSQAVRDEETGRTLGSVHILLSAERIYREQKHLQEIMILTGLLLVAGVAGTCLWIARRVTRPVKNLLEDMATVARGDLTHKTVVRSTDEIGAIATQFYRMTRQLHLARDREKEAQHLEDELEVARQIQMKLLPPRIPQIRGLDIQGTYLPAKEVGGDYYDFFPIDRERLGIIVADVSGKGIPGSMIMATTRTILRFAAASSTSAADTLVRTNQVVAADIRRGMFVTAFYLVLNARTHEILAASAGHNPMAVYRGATRTVELVNPDGIALGFDRGPLFQKTIQEQSLQIYPGDRVVLYTDGVVELMNEAQEEYSNDRFYEFIRTHSDLSSDAFVEALLDDLEVHAGASEQNDDVTVVTFRAE
ncbi:MAG: SpoIIE family protein phosphatase [Planctomycetota bacterium]